MRPRTSQLLGLLLLLALAACAPSPHVHPRAAEQLRRGYQHLGQGDAERAEVAFEHALAFDPDLPEGWTGLGVVARARGDAALARRHFRRAVRLAPDFAEGRANLGEALLAEGRAGEAVEALRAALALEPDLAGARLALARALLQRGLLAAEERPARWAEARREYLHLLESDGEHPLAHQDLAFLAYLGGRLEEAEAGYRRAAALAPSPDAHHGHCLALAGLGRCQEARAACDRCLALAPAAEACRVSRRGVEACAP